MLMTHRTVVVLVALLLALGAWLINDSGTEADALNHASRVSKNARVGANATIGKNVACPENHIVRTFHHRLRGFQVWRWGPDLRVQTWVIRGVGRDLAHFSIQNGTDETILLRLAATCVPEVSPA